MLSFNTVTYSTSLADDSADDLAPPKGSPSAGLTLEDSGALDCGICCHPLKPPIFQCIAGHVMCSQCQGKHRASFDGKCHMCRAAIRGYFRCHAMEHLVASVRVPCPHAAHGCDARPAYYDWRRRGETCPHALYACPRQGCGFVGPAAAILHHLSGAHIGVRAVQRFWAREVCAAMAKLDMAADMEDEATDEDGFGHKDVELVSIQVGVPWDEAVRSLREHHGDLVQAILSLVD